MFAPNNLTRSTTILLNLPSPSLYLTTKIFLPSIHRNMTQMVRTRAILSVILLLSVQLLHLKMALAATFMVGDAAGWTFNVAAWPNGKNFKAGDQLGMNQN